MPIKNKAQRQKFNQPQSRSAIEGVCAYWRPYYRKINNAR